MGSLDQNDANGYLHSMSSLFVAVEYSTLRGLMHGMVNIAIRAARRAGEIMIRQLNRLESLEVAEKGRNDFVTRIDHLAEEAREVPGTTFWGAQITGVPTTRRSGRRDRGSRPPG